MHRFANPARFLRIARVLTLPLTLLGLVLTAAGLWIGLFDSPPDYQQGESVRIMYVHVPAAWLGSGGYLGLAVASAVALVWRHPLAEIAARAIAPVGAAFTAICLISGSLWGKPTWGTYWVWDARLTSMLVLLFLYLGYLALSSAEAERGGGKAASILAIVGVINLPIIKYSVEWWNTLHQGSSIKLSATGASSSIAPEMLMPLLLSVAGFSLLFGAIVLMRMRAALAEQAVAARSRRIAAAYT
ncbi:heme ABC transporter permease [Polymorphobacter arshaanensis]|uniref:Heme exporter protein C n=1 Tax=Glacieibacterium arshaanense TaxID=2511025 RepID=A0A4Y9ELJ7_9SPHN|nr:heme ABC transporter permease [Polymorphobacter arshaanensis]TFU01125.1 heme ABC transporter permease [Polymorphobacter arshaanensis]